MTLPSDCSVGLFTDLYQLRMMQGYFLRGQHDTPCVFHYFFRNNPFGGGYVVFAGLSDLLAQLDTCLFDEDSLTYLSEQGFDSSFVDYLRDFRFQGTVLSVMEGEVVFSCEPVMQIRASIFEAQWLETLLLNTINFQSLVATKAARMRDVAKDRQLIDFGLRRAQGLGGMAASRAAIIGGFVGTSNVAAAARDDIPAIGTMAHAWIQTFESELEAFHEFATIYGDATVLLIDTYDTLQSGLPNAIAVAKAMKAKGGVLRGVRLDSGDLAYLSRQVRAGLDEAGLIDVQIIVSNQLDEYLIDSLLRQQAPIDVFAVGTKLVTADQSPALDGVYKLCEYNQRPTLKLSNNIEKMTLPGRQQVYRYFDERGDFYADAIALHHESGLTAMHHPAHAHQVCALADLEHEALLKPVFQHGEPCLQQRSLMEIAQDSLVRRQSLPSEYRRFENPHAYKVGISRDLMQLRDELMASVTMKGV